VNFKSRLSFFDQNTISAWLLVLIFIQIILSALIIRRLNDVDQSLADLSSINTSNIQASQSELPPYVENVSIDDDPWRGTQDAPVTIVEFSDYQCPFCAEIAPTINEILAEFDGQVLFVYRDLPLESIHPDAFKAAEAANCAGEQGKYWEMHDTLFANQSALSTDALKEYATILELDMDQFNHCLDTGQYESEIRHDMQQAGEYQAGSTPTFFVNGQRVLGANPDALRSVIQNILGEEG
jgi:protein-disulfide isomerase